MELEKTAEAAELACAAAAEALGAPPESRRRLVMSGAWVWSLAWLGSEGRVHSQCTRQALRSIFATCMTPSSGEQQRNKWAADL